RHYDGDVADRAVAATEPGDDCGRPPPRLGDLALLPDRDEFHGYFHRAIVIRVPLPGAVSILNSLHRRLAPPRPRPSPPPVVKPSRSACSTSAMPGPESSKV